MENFTISTEVSADTDNAKILAIFVLGIGSFFFGILPAGISHYNRRRFPLLISLLLCFGAGVLLATSLIHMLPELKEQLGRNAELIFCGGFFLIYFIDEFVHYFCGEATQHSHGENESHRHSDAHQHHNDNYQTPKFYQNYGSDGVSERQTLLSGSSCQNADDDHHIRIRQTAVLVTSDENAESCEAESANARICHVSHQESCEQSRTGTFGLLGALSLHSLLEGLAIGVQSSGPTVMLLFGAVACHKFVMGFCLGIELRANENSTLRSQAASILVFSLGSVCGIALGMAIFDLPQGWIGKSVPVLQALAGGTLLYVTICEVMPREKARWHKSPCRIAGMAQFSAIAIGFGLMTILSFYFTE